MPKLRKDVERLVGKLFATEPFKSRKKDFNVRVLELPAAKSGVHRPRTRDDRRTPHRRRVQHLRFGALRPHARQPRAARRRVVRAVRLPRDPREREAVRRRRDLQRSGDVVGRQRLRRIRLRPRVRPSLRRPRRRVLHVRRRVRDRRREHPEPWEPNITANGARPKWMDLVDAGHAAADAVGQGSVRGAPARVSGRAARSCARRTCRSRRWTSCSAASRSGRRSSSARRSTRGRSGAFEGAGYEAKGLYRPEVDCIMFTRDEVGFCDVCRRAIERMIDMYTK